MAQPWQKIQACVEQADVPQFVDHVRQHVQNEGGSALGSLSEELLRHCFLTVSVLPCPREFIAAIMTDEEADHALEIEA